MVKVDVWFRAEVQGSEEVVGFVQVPRTWVLFP